MAQPRKYDEFMYPRRRPWLLFVLVIAGGLVFWQRTRPKAEKPPPVELPEQAEPVAATASAPNRAGAAPVSQDMDVNLLVNEGRAFEQRGEFLKARESYREVLKRIGEGALRVDIEDRLGRVNVELAFTPRPMPEKVEYIVKSGDYLARLAKDHGSTVDLIQQANKLSNSNLIRKGDRLWILKGTFRILVSKTKNEVTVFFNDEFFKRYSVGTGKDGCTPVGTFKIAQKIKEPDWWRPDGKQVPYGDKENILGTRWMSLRATGDTPDVRSYGIHGTWDESSIGKAESAGCVRMRNKDVEELYVLIPVETPVDIIE